MDEGPSRGRYKRPSHRNGQAEWERAPGARYRREEDDGWMDRAGGTRRHDARPNSGAAMLPGPYRFPPPQSPLPPQKFLWRSLPAGPYFCGVRCTRWHGVVPRGEPPNGCGAGERDATADGMHVGSGPGSGNTWGWRELPRRAHSSGVGRSNWVGASVTGVGLVCDGRLRVEQTRTMVGITYRERISGYP